MGLLWAGGDVSRTVWKYELVPGENVIRVPTGARLVHVAPWQPGKDGPAVWIERERDADPDSIIRVQVVGTGHDVPESGVHLGSAWCDLFMWHVYELRSEGVV